MPVRKKTEDFALALRAVRDELHMTQEVFGALVDAAPRSLTRWEVHGELPHIAQRTHMAMKVARLASSARLQTLVDAMDVGDLVDAAALSARSRATLDPEAAQRALDASLLVLAEDLDVNARKARAAVVKLLQSLEAAGLPVGEARARLQRERK